MVRMLTRLALALTAVVAFSLCAHAQAPEKAK
jgi:hypothetical protein